MNLWGRVWALMWAVFAWFVLLRASGVQWLVLADSLSHGIRIAAAYALVIPIAAYAVVLFGKRLRYAPAVGVLNLHILAVAWLHNGTGSAPTLACVAWPFGGVAVGAIVAAALANTLPRVPPP